MGDLPPLPEPAHRGTDVSGWYSDAFTAAQLVAFAEEAVKFEREACAKVCDDFHEGQNGRDNYGKFIARLIRARSSQVEQGKL